VGGGLGRPEVVRVGSSRGAGRLGEAPDGAGLSGRVGRDGKRGAGAGRVVAWIVTTRVGADSQVPVVP
jgi:hypothetical protein